MWVAMDEKYPEIGAMLGRVDMGIANMQLDKDLRLRVCLHIKTPHIKQKRQLECITVPMAKYIDPALEEGMSAIFSIPGINLVAALPSSDFVAAPVNAVLHPAEDLLMAGRKQIDTGTKPVRSVLDRLTGNAAKPLTDIFAVKYDESVQRKPGGLGGLVKMFL